MYRVAIVGRGPRGEARAGLPVDTLSQRLLSRNCHVVVRAYAPNQVTGQARRDDGVVPSSVSGRLIVSHPELLQNDGLVDSLSRRGMVGDPLRAPSDRVARLSP